MEKEKVEFIENRLAEIIADARASILEGARLEICEAKETIADFLDYFSNDGEEYQFTHSIAGVWSGTLAKIVGDHKAGKDFGESIDDITSTELMEFIGTGRLKMLSTKERFPNAFKPWSGELDAKLEEMWCAGTSYEELSEYFGRNENAVKLRVVRLELEEKYGVRPTGKLNVQPRY